MIDLTYDRVAGDWQAILSDFFNSTQGLSLLKFLRAREEAGVNIFPPTPFKALELTPLAQTHVVIVGQDPYHGKGQAQGLAFHVSKTCKIPPSLRNIHKELLRDLKITPPDHGDLTGWAQQGVLLLNTVLTVEEGKANSHAKKGWETLTDALLTELANFPSPKVFLLWGNYAQSKQPLIESGHGVNAVLCANHPSPLSALRPPVPFIGCGHFSETNRLLVSRGVRPIDWSLFSSESDEFNLQFSLSF